LPSKLFNLKSCKEKNEYGEDSQIKDNKISKDRRLLKMIADENTRIKKKTESLAQLEIYFQMKTM